MRTRGQRARCDLELAAQALRLFDAAARSLLERLRARRAAPRAARRRGAIAADASASAGGRRLQLGFACRGLRARARRGARSASPRLRASRRVERPCVLGCQRSLGGFSAAASAVGATPAARRRRSAHRRRRRPRRRGLVERGAGGAAPPAPTRQPADAKRSPSLVTTTSVGVGQRQVERRAPVAVDDDGGREQRVEQRSTPAVGPRTWRPHRLGRGGGGRPRLPATSPPTGRGRRRERVVGAGAARSAGAAGGPPSTTTAAMASPARRLERGLPARRRPRPGRAACRPRRRGLGQALGAGPGAGAVERQRQGLGARRRRAPFASPARAAAVGRRRGSSARRRSALGAASARRERDLVPRRSALGAQPVARFEAAVEASGQLACSPRPRSTLASRLDARGAPRAARRARRRGRLRLAARRPSKAAAAVELVLGVGQLARPAGSRARWRRRPRRARRAMRGGVGHEGLDHACVGDGCRARARSAAAPLGQQRGRARGPLAQRLDAHERVGEVVAAGARVELASAPSTERRGASSSRAARARVCAASSARRRPPGRQPPVQTADLAAGEVDLRAPAARRPARRGGGRRRPGARAAQLAAHLAQQVAEAQEVALGGLEPALGLLPAPAGTSGCRPPPR